MRPNHLAAWRLRVDPLRVYYDLSGDLVTIQRIARKIGTRVVTPTGEELQTDE